MNGLRRAWQDLRILLLRFHKDRRARRKLIWLTYIVLACIYELLNLVLNPGVWILAPFVAIALWIIVRSKRADEESFLKLSVTTPSAPREPDIMLHRVRLATRLRVEVGWACRAMREAVLKEANRDQGDSTTDMRSAVNQLLRNYGLWEGLNDTERALMMGPEGTWSVRNINQHWASGERTRVLMWVLGFEALQPPNTDQAPGFRSIIAVLRAPSLTEQPKPLVPNYELRMQKRLAGEYFNRCLWELEHRAEQGLLQAFESDAEARRQFLETNASDVWGDENADLLIGAQSVSQTEAEAVSRVLNISYARYWALGGILKYLEGGAEADLQLEPLGSSADESEPEGTLGQDKGPAEVN